MVSMRFRSRVISNPAFNELIKAHLATWLIVRQPLRYIFSELLEVLVHRYLLYVVHRIRYIIGFVLGIRILDPFTVEHLLLIKQCRQFIDVHSIDKSIVC